MEPQNLNVLKRFLTLIALAGFLSNPAVATTDLAYEYGPDGQLTGIIDNLDPSASKTISYDALNRLVQVAEGIPAPAGTPIPVEDYAYDGEGNRTASHLSNLYSSNDHNQLTEDDTYTYAYDTKGNRVSRTAKVGGEVETYTYDSQNRLVGYFSLTTTATYAYDALGRRAAKTVDSVATAFVYDPWAVDSSTASDIVMEFKDGVLDRRWLHSGRVDEPLSHEQYLGDDTPGSGSVYEMYADRMGSISKVVDVATGAVVAEYEYDAFGNQTQFAGSLFQFYGYTGRETDDESGLIYYRARTFDPAVGQFLQRDPIGFGAGDLNLYTYVENNPFGYLDPSGHKSRPRALSQSSAEYALLLGGTMAMTGAAIQNVYGGLINGPLDQLMRMLWQASLMMDSSDSGDTSSGDGGDTGGNQCGPGGGGPSKWEKAKEVLLAVVETIAAILGVHDNMTTRPTIDDISISKIERRIKGVGEWNNGTKEIDDIYENGIDPDDPCN